MCNALQLVDSNVIVKCLGGRELRGALRGYDELVNLVLDDCDEYLRGACTAQYLHTIVYHELQLFVTCYQNIIFSHPR